MAIQTTSTVVFIKDTCILIVIAYLLSRGRLLSLLFKPRLRLAESIILGVILGSISLGISLLPGIGYQYAAHTLFSVFATLTGGLQVGLIVVMVTSFSVVLSAPYRVLETLCGVFISWLLGSHLHRTNSIPMRLAIGFLAGAIAQSTRILLHNVLVGIWNIPVLPTTALFSVVLNGFGVALLLLVVSDAQVRADSEQRRVEAERAHALASEAQLTALRVRMHPHFLFNALNSIAELCCIAPERAEKACLNLSQLMRRTLDTSVANTIPLREELALARAYLQIEQERLGDRLKVIWNTDAACEETGVVPLALQLLVENAVNHGLLNKMAPGTIAITIRGGPRRTVIAVRDDGVGMPLEARMQTHRQNSPATHGLQLLDQQLVLQHGNKARLRLFSREKEGTLAVFALPKTNRSH